jgi:YidC/Oxa1 family membrane protein insertase
VNPDQLRPMLFIALAFVAFLLWEQWQADYGQKPATEVATQSQTGTGADGTAPASPDVPAIPTTAVSADAASDTPAAEIKGFEPAKELVTIQTDTVRATIDTRGGTIRSVDLLKYPVELAQPDKPLRLLDDKLPNFFIAQSGLLGLGGVKAPSHDVTLQSERKNYVLDTGAQSIEVPMYWESGDGVTVRKVFVFKRNSYVVDVRYEVINGTDKDWPARMYGQLQRTQVPEDNENAFIYTYMGGVLSSEEKPYEKVDFSDMEDADIGRDVQGGWAAMIQHYFVGAWIPRVGTETQAADTNYYYTKALPGERYVIGVMTPDSIVSAGDKAVFSLKTYIGPKDQVRMTNAAPGLDRTVDYGWLFLIAQPLFWALTLIYSFLGNWGFSIIVLTLLIKAAFFHLSATSYRSMARMRKLQPKMVALRERHGDDRTKMNQAMMELYRKEKINPLGGCLPIVVQIPVFISLYWMLLESVELRQAPFMFWLNDLSQHDPYFVLPVVMGVSMLIQQRLNPTPPDPVQAKVMMALPFIFTFFFLWFPSGLVLYWVVNNVLSIAQQYVITKKIEAEK